MRYAIIASLATAALAITGASPISNLKRDIVPEKTLSVSVLRRENFQHNVNQQLAKLNLRYPTLQAMNATNGTGVVTLVDGQNDTEYYGLITVGTPAQNVSVDFDTGSADIWFPSISCNAAACLNHDRFNPNKSSSFQTDGVLFNITYGDNSTSNGYLGTDNVTVGGITVWNQTFGLTTNESVAFQTSPFDGLFGLGFQSLESVNGTQTWFDNAIADGLLAQPIVSAYLPSERRANGTGGEYLFGAINSTLYTGNLTYVNVTEQGYWQVLVEDAAFNGTSINQTSQAIIDTGTTLVIVSNSAAQAFHSFIPGAIFVTTNTTGGWLIPCSNKNSTENISFTMASTPFNISVADIVYEPVSSNGTYCVSGIQGGQADLWILGDVFIKNNYCVFSKAWPPSIGIAPLAY